MIVADDDDVLVDVTVAVDDDDDDDVGVTDGVLRSTAGSWLRAGDEDVRMREGELWWFDNQQVHEARNDGDQDRIHLIFDLLPCARAAEVFGTALADGQAA